MPKGIEIRDLTVGTGDEATKDSVVLVDVRTFLRRGDEVGRSPFFGTKNLIDLGRRDHIAGLRYGIPGMRVGGTREIVISPHLAYGKEGVPGSIPANALLRCEVELLEIRKHNALLRLDWLPGKTVSISFRGVGGQDLHWGFNAHEDGNAQFVLKQATTVKRARHARVKQIPLSLEAEESASLIRMAMALPEQMREDCVTWGSGFIDMPNGTAIKDKRDGAHCPFVIHVTERGETDCIFAVRENSHAFLASDLYITIERMIAPHLNSDPEVSERPSPA
jgi:hypothetical protein